MRTLLNNALAAFLFGTTMQGFWMDAHAQHIDTWKNYTDMKSLRAVVMNEGVLWGATSGGLFSSDGGTIVKYTNSEGLSSNDLTALAVDGSGRIWIGSEQGDIDVFDPMTRQWLYIRDVVLSNRIQKSIRSFWVTSDSVFVATDFGVSVFRLSRWEFGDTYANFGFASQAGVNQILILNDQLWLATDLGVATAPRYSVNLSSPSSWTRFQSTEGLPADAATSITAFHDTIVVGTTLGVAYKSLSGFQGLSSSMGMQIKTLVSSANRLLILWNRPPYALAALTSVLDSLAPALSDPQWMGNDVVTDSTGTQVFIATAGDGIHQRGTVTATIIPNGPQSNLFSSLAVDARGVLWCASGISGQGHGFYRCDPSLPETKQWQNFAVGSNSVMSTDDYYKVSAGSGGRIWVSSWGRGVVEIAGDTIRRKINENSTPNLASSVFSTPPFVVVGGVATDPDGKDWFVNRTALNGNYLARLISDTSFSFYTNLLSPGQGLFTAIVVDQNGTKWMANAEPFNKPATGLYYFNEQDRVPGTSVSGGWGMMTTADGLPNNTVLSVAVDRDGSVCIGTDLGLMIVSDPLYPRQRHFSSFPLREQSIQAIAIDAVNNKWVGTKEGVFVMNGDATQILQQYTVSSTGGKLVDNDVRAIAIDQQRGRAYLGTEKGLSSIEIAPVSTARSFATIRVAPNPFKVPSGTPLEIRNLVSESFIKILAVDGSLMTEFRAQGGGRAFWDGTDSFGNLVGSGIYFVVAYAQNGDQVGSGKIAVIRH